MIELLECIIRKSSSGSREVLDEWPHKLPVLHHPSIVWKTEAAHSTSAA